MEKLLKIAYKLATNIDQNVIIKEHNTPQVSYMVFKNLDNLIQDAQRLKSMLNDKDDLPAWADEYVSLSKDNLDKVIDYVSSEKTTVAEATHLFYKLASKYDHIDFTPPESVAEVAKRALELRKQNKGKGGLSAQEAGAQGIGSGVVRAVSLKNRKKLSPSTIRMMKSFFDRHEKSAKIDKGKTKENDKGRIAWLLWGGDPGRAWANKLVKQMDAADKKK